MALNRFSSILDDDEPSHVKAAGLTSSSSSSVRSSLVSDKAPEAVASEAPTAVESAVENIQPVEATAPAKSTPPQEPTSKAPTAVKLSSMMETRLPSIAPQAIQESLVSDSMPAVKPAESSPVMAEIAEMKERIDSVAVKSPPPADSARPLQIFRALATRSAFGRESFEGRYR